MTLFMRDQKNREEGAHNRSVEIARKMLKLNKNTLQDIADVTGLKLEEVEALAHLKPV